MVPGRIAIIDEVWTKLEANNSRELEGEFRGSVLNVYQVLMSVAVAIGLLIGLRSNKD